MFALLRTLRAPLPHAFSALPRGRSPASLARAGSASHNAAASVGRPLAAGVASGGSPLAAAAARAPPEAASVVTNWRTGSAIGLVSSFLGASAGVGGALFSIPMMCRFAHFSQRLAAGTALFAVVGVSSSGAYVFSQADQIDTPAALYLSASAAVFAPLGVVASRSASPHLLRRTLGLFLMSVAPLMPIRSALQNGYFGSQTDATPADPDFSLADQHLPVLLLAGSSVGFISGLLGVGGGTLFTPTIAFLAGNQYADFHTVLGTSFLAMTLPSVTGAFSYWRMGQASMAIVPSLCFGTMVGATAGSRFALTVPEEQLRAAFAIIFSILGWRIFRSRRLLSKSSSR